MPDDQESPNGNIVPSDSESKKSYLADIPATRTFERLWSRFGNMLFDLANSKANRRGTSTITDVDIEDAFRELTSILDPKNWTTKIDRIDVLMVQLEGVRDGSETTEDRVRAEGEGSVGGGAWRPDYERVGVSIWRSSDSDRLLAEAVIGGGGRTVL